MNDPTINGQPSLERLLERFAQLPEVQVLADRYRNHADNPEPSDGWQRPLYEALIAIVEPRLSMADRDGSLLALYQGLFRELEQLPGQVTEGQRHRFIITIPVADRPHHLTQCLESLLELCHRYHYGGCDAGRFTLVRVVIADDSKAAENIATHRTIAETFTRQGLDCYYLSQAEQQQLVERLDVKGHPDLRAVVGGPEQAADGHKGASITRNIAYLKLRELAADDDRVLFFFIDSDQEFKVTLNTSEGEREAFAVNYLYHLDRLFTASEATLLTGKVVGDPPVSPSVMANNLLGDLLALLSTLASHDPLAACGFHPSAPQQQDDAAYHDMADLFGFTPSATFNYLCPLKGSHTHRDAFAHVATHLGRFFDGEHPTRKSYYEAEPLDATLKPARTVYTGNYIFNRQGLDYFIPFAAMRLRMAGPVLGRLIKAQLGDRFISANLPMLHKRTVDHVGRSECRPGIDRTTEHVDLAGEFERQFYGDVLLFTTELLTERGYPDTPVTESLLRATLSQVDTRMHTRYEEKHRQIIERLVALRALLDDQTAWWNAADARESIGIPLNHFAANMAHNFNVGALPYRLINDRDNRVRRHNEMVEALLGYQASMKAWRYALRQQGERSPRV